MLRIPALVQTVFLLAACAPKPAHSPGIYASVDYSVDAPNPIVPGIPRYFHVVDDRRVVVYYPKRATPPKARGQRASFVWVEKTWSIARISDRASGPDDVAQCCRYRASLNSASKGTLWLSHFRTGDNLAWFPPDLGRRRDYLRVIRMLPRTGSSYSFTHAALNIRV